MFHWIQVRALGHSRTGVTPLSSCLWVIVMLEDESFPRLKSRKHRWSLSNATQVLGWFHFSFGHTHSHTRTCGHLSCVSIPHGPRCRQWPSQWTIFSQTADFFMEQWCHRTIILLELEQSAAPQFLSLSPHWTRFLMSSWSLTAQQFQVCWSRGPSKNTAGHSVWATTFCCCSSGSWSHSMSMKKEPQFILSLRNLTIPNKQTNKQINSNKQCFGNVIP